MGYKLLLVDDDPEVRNTLCEALSSGLSVEIVLAQDGLEGLEKAKSNEVIAILTDMKMPLMDGLQMMEKVIELRQDIPFVFLTGYGDKEHLIKALKLGALDFLEKPINVFVLMTSLKRAIEIGLKIEKLKNEIAEKINRLSVSEQEKRTYFEAKLKTELIKCKNEYADSQKRKVS